MKTYNGINNDLQNTTQKSDYWATGNPQKAGSSCPTDKISNDGTPCMFLRNRV
jgi:hypothetical protein